MPLCTNKLKQLLSTSFLYCIAESFLYCLNVQEKIVLTNTLMNVLCTQESKFDIWLAMHYINRFFTAITKPKMQDSAQYHLQQRTNFFTRCSDYDEHKVRLTDVESRRMKHT